MKGWQLLGMWLGLFVGIILESVLNVSLLVVALLLSAAFVSALWWRRFETVSLLAVSLCLLLMCVGLVRTQWYEAQFVDSPLASEVGERVTLTGWVAQEPDERSTFTQLFIQTETDRVLVRIDRFVNVSYGDEVQVSGKLEVPEVFVTDTGRAFDYPRYLQVRGVQYVISFASIEVVESSRGNPLLALLYQSKLFFIEKLEVSIPSPQVDLGIGLLLGVKQALGDELETAFRQTGIIHIVVLSGYNIMLVVGFFWWLSSWVLPLRGRIVFGLIGITLFALLVGLSATVMRASLMAAILLIGKWIGRPYDVLRALLFAAGVMMLINPYILLFDIGFQLSFMATLGLVLVLPQFESTLATDTSSLKLVDLFRATVVTQIFVLPLLMYHIGEVSLVSVLVNMLVLPMVPLAMMLTFVVGLVSMVSVSLGTLAGVLAQLSLQYILLLAEWFGRLPLAVVVIPEVGLPAVLSMYAAIALVYYWWVSKTQEDGAVDPAAGWNIVEEAVEQTGSEAIASDPVDDTPVLFR